MISCGISSSINLHSHADQSSRVLIRMDFSCALICSGDRGLCVCVCECEPSFKHLFSVRPLKVWTATVCLGFYVCRVCVPLSAALVSCSLPLSSLASLSPSPYLLSFSFFLSHSPFSLCLCLCDEPMTSANTHFIFSLPSLLGVHTDSRCEDFLSQLRKDEQFLTLPGTIVQQRRLSLGSRRETED